MGRTRRSSALRRESLGAGDGQPLTELPGNEQLLKELQERLASSQPLALLRLDIDNFRIFNYVYGYALGDRAIQTLAIVLGKAVASLNGEGDLVAHLGGDDFAVITVPSRASALAQLIVDGFDRQIRTLYRPDHLEQGYLEWPNRLGQVTRYPILTVSIGIATNERYAFSSHLHFDEVALEVQRYGKTVAGSSYHFDRRAADDRQSAGEDDISGLAVAWREETDLPDQWKNAYVSLIAHELRSPVTVMQMVIDILIAHPPEGATPEHRRYLLMAQRNCQRLSRTVANLSAYDTLQERQDVFRTGQFDLQTAIGRVVELAQDIAADKQVRISVEQTDNLTCALTGEVAFTHALWEVLDNAVKFGRQGGTVRIVAGVVGHQVNVEVSDDGPGIPPSDLRRIFRSFQQLEDPLTRKARGLGLGLYVARQLMECLDGTINVRSRVGQGSTFVLSFPRRWTWSADRVSSFRKRAHGMIGEAYDELRELELILASGRPSANADQSIATLKTSLVELEALIQRTKTLEQELNGEFAREQEKVQEAKTHLLRTLGSAAAAADSAPTSSAD